MLAGLRGEESIAAICRSEGIAESLYYKWSKEFLEAGKKRLSGDTARQATSDEVHDLKRENRDVKELLADLMLENRLLQYRHDLAVCKSRLLHVEPPNWKILLPISLIWRGDYRITTPVLEFFNAIGKTQTEEVGSLRPNWSSPSVVVRCDSPA